MIIYKIRYYYTSKLKASRIRLLLMLLFYDGGASSMYQQCRSRTAYYWYVPTTIHGYKMVREYICTENTNDVLEVGIVVCLCRISIWYNMYFYILLNCISRPDYIRIRHRHHHQHAAADACLHESLLFSSGCCCFSPARPDKMLMMAAYISAAAAMEIIWVSTGRMMQQWK